MTRRIEAEVQAFVLQCKAYPHGARRKDLPLATRYVDKIRQTARKLGLVVYEDRGKGKRWFATDPEPGKENT
ncbi:hypothetical protein [Marinobacter salarius]|uniref:hypothetical protein n=1 Tax=Marinobacter salarius TaxID=1420917 RepID=UPI0032ECD217